MSLADWLLPLIIPLFTHFFVSFPLPLVHSCACAGLHRIYSYKSSEVPFYFVDRKTPSFVLRPIFGPCASFILKGLPFFSFSVPFCLLFFTLILCCLKICPRLGGPFFSPPAFSASFFPPVQAREDPPRHPSVFSLRSLLPVPILTPLTKSIYFLFPRISPFSPSPCTQCHPPFTSEVLSSFSACGRVSVFCGQKSKPLTFPLLSKLREIAFLPCTIRCRLSSYFLSLVSPSSLF